MCPWNEISSCLSACSWSRKPLVALSIELTVSTLQRMQISWTICQSGVPLSSQSGDALIDNHLLSGCDSSPHTLPPFFTPSLFFTLFFSLFISLSLSPTFKSPPPSISTHPHMVSQFLRGKAAVTVKHHLLIPSSLRPLSTAIGDWYLRHSAYICRHRTFFSYFISTIRISTVWLYQFGVHQHQQRNCESPRAKPNVSVGKKYETLMVSLFFLTGNVERERKLG